MENNKNQAFKSQNLFRFIAIYEIVSGIFGFWFVLFQAVSATTSTTQQDVVFLFCSLMSVVMLLAGIALFKLQAVGYYTSVVLHLFQVFGVRWGQSFVFSLGTWFAVGFDASKDVFFYEFSLMAVNFAVGQTSKSLFFIGIVPTIVLFLLYMNRHDFFHKKMTEMRQEIESSIP